MPEPLVCAVMLTKDRPAMAKRAVECFRKQTYQNKSFMILDTGDRLFFPGEDLLEGGYVYCLRYEGPKADSIGELRNDANHAAVVNLKPDIMIHWDDDDHSHPNRISEQVALLQASGKQCVGYRDMLFWRSGMVGLKDIPSGRYLQALPGEAWLYTNNDPRYCVGTSLCYWRSTWERRPFPDISRGEDKAWLREVDSLGETSLFRFQGPSGSGHDDLQPRMIASIHSGNHVVYEPEKSPHNFKRVPEWDAYCREKMTL